VLLTLTIQTAACQVSDNGHGSTQTDVVCRDPAGLSFSAPELWTVVSPEFEAYTQWLTESPYRLGKSNLIERSVDDIAVFGDHLYAGLGDYSYNTGSRFCVAEGGSCLYEDAPGHGIPVYRFAKGDPQAEHKWVIQQEEIQRFRQTGRALFVPPIDPTLGDPAPGCVDPASEAFCLDEAARDHERFITSTFYKLEGGQWHSQAKLEGSNHGFDVAVAGRRIYGSGSGKPPGSPDSDDSYAMIWRSDDNGETFTIDLVDDAATGYRRVHTLLALGDTVVALGTHVDDEVSARYVGSAGQWREIEEWRGPDGILQSQPVDQQRGLIWGTGGLWSVTMAGGQVTLSDELLDPDTSIVDVDLLCEGDVLVLTWYWDEGFMYSVQRSTDLVSWQTIATSEATMRLSSFAYWDGSLFFGGREGELYRAAGQPERR
jgi:hypothetical protein